MSDQGFDLSSTTTTMWASTVNKLEEKNTKLRAEITKFEEGIRGFETIVAHQSRTIEALREKLASAEAVIKELEVILLRAGHVPKKGSLNPVGDWLNRANEWHKLHTQQQEPPT